VETALEVMAEHKDESKPSRTLVIERTRARVTTPAGDQVAVKTVNLAGAGALFGLAVAPFGAGVYLVDDALNNLDLFN
jgi:hypothetical protein